MVGLIHIMTHIQKLGFLLEVVLKKWNGGTYSPKNSWKNVQHVLIELTRKENFWLGKRM
jgi:hypothetical protein